MSGMWEGSNTHRAVLSVLQSCYSGDLMMDSTTAGLLLGRLTADDIPFPVSRLIRVFLCSAATDSRTERSAFVENVYPKLREYCRHKYDLEFQMVDLAWGVLPEQLLRDRTFPSVKMDEIRKCQRTSVGPNFIAFLGQKYGSRPLPASILVEEFESVMLALHAHRGRETRNAPLLNECYIRDSNSAQPVYVLKDISGVFPAMMSDDFSVRQLAEQQWQQLQVELCLLLQRGAELAYLDGVLDSDVRAKFFMSDLENEIQLGLENCDNPHKRCVLILRDIVDLKNYVQDPRASSFINLYLDDIIQELAVDDDCENRLGVLKNRSRGLISEANTLQHEVLWRYEDVIHPKLHKEYLDKLCAELRQVLERLVDECVPSLLHQKRQAPVVYESLQHWSRCKDISLDFFPSQPQMHNLRDHVTAASSSTPLVLYGPPGCGKTKLVSKLALELMELVPDNLVSIIRYVGLTPQSSNLRHLLMGIVTQLVIALGCSPDDIPRDFKDLQTFFAEFIHSVPPQYHVVIIFDSLEQMSPEHNAHLLAWVPVELPDNVKIILTVPPDQHGLLERLQKEVLKDHADSFVFIQPLALPDSHILLGHFLQHAGRLISEEQLASLADRMLEYCQPLYVKLIAEQAKELYSFSDASQIEMPRDCQHGVQQFFDRLEAKHGLPVVSRSMAYMVASATGVSDLEMEDLLSLDDTVLNHLFRDHHPPLRRVPFNVWLKVRRDIESFLFEKEADGVTVTVWEHQAFVHAIRGRYLSKSDDVMAIHSLLADYFLGTWSGRPKPLQLPEGVTHIPPCGDPADRLVPSQPLTFPSEQGSTETKFNKRMYEQVPRHLDLSGRQSEQTSLVLFNYQWLYSKMKALSLHHVLADFALDTGPQASLVAEALRAAAPTIEKDMNNLPAEITGRLLPYYDTFPNIRALIRSCDIDGLKHCALLPNFPYLQVPGSSLQFTLENPSVADYLGLVFDERYLLTKKTTESNVYVFDLLTGELKDTIFTSKGEMHVTPNGEYFLIVDHVTEKSVKIHSSGNGAFLGQIILMNHLGVRCENYKAGPLALTNDRLCGIVHTNDTSILFLSEIPSGRMLQIVMLDGKGTVCGISPGLQHVVCNSNEYVIVYDLYSLQQVCSVTLSHKPTALAFTGDGQRVYLTCAEELSLTILKLKKGEVELTFKAPLASVLQCDLIKALCVSPNDQYVLVRTSEHIVVHKRATETVQAHFVKPEQVPKEFRLPKQNYQELVFTNAAFTRDSNCVIATLFRNIYIWQISNSQLLCSIQAPIGIIHSLLVCKHRGQIITKNSGSTHIHVWNRLARRAVQRMDRMTAAVERVLVTSDNSRAYVQCRDSDEVGVIDIRSGAMVDLLTHDNKVEDMAITPSGHMALVSTQPRLSNTACKLWDLPGRMVLKEFGAAAGLCTSLHTANTFVLMQQPEPFFHCPWDLSLLHLIGSTHTVHHHVQACQYVRSRPVVTWDDRCVVVSSALEYDDHLGQFVAPCLIVFDMTAGLKRSCYDARSVGLDGVMEDILDIQPCAKDVSSVAVLVACRRPSGLYEDEEEVQLGAVSSTEVVNMPKGSKAIPRTDSLFLDDRHEACLYVREVRKKEAELQVGFFILDVMVGCITTMTFIQPSPQIPFPPRMVFSQDLTLCMDDASCLYNLAENSATAHSPPDPSIKKGPQCLALYGKIAVYVSDTALFAVRVEDWATIGRVEVHAQICHVTLCPDQRTLLVGCTDGTLASYAIVDPQSGDVPLTSWVSEIQSRLPPGPDTLPDGRHARAWDKVQQTTAPPYSRPPSALSAASKDKQILQQIQPVKRARPKSDTLLYVNDQTSRACCVM